jgi:predicted DNA-binding protein YlxM (UPF0122 family)
MTLKEIAGLLNQKSTKTILSWIKNGQNMTVNIGQKLTIAQKEKKPADFTLEETLEILRAGKVEKCKKIHRPLMLRKIYIKNLCIKN